MEEFYPPFLPFLGLHNGLHFYQGTLIHPGQISERLHQQDVPLLLQLLLHLDENIVGEVVDTGTAGEVVGIDIAGEVVDTDIVGEVVDIEEEGVDTRSEVGLAVETGDYNTAVEEELHWEGSTAVGAHWEVGNTHYP